MKIALLTNEYPPNVYGGAGIHVEYLTRELARLDGGRHQVRVLCFGQQDVRQGGLSVRGVAPASPPPHHDPRHAKLMDTLERNILMTGILDGADIVHCHTWYVALAGCLLKRLAGAALVVTSHSLEPHRPWKREQLGTGYDVSSWLERTSYANADGIIAVSSEMRRDVKALYDPPADRIRVIHNGIDLEQYKCDITGEVFSRYGIDRNRPYILFVGRISRQKGIFHLLEAARHLQFAQGRRSHEGPAQLVLAATSPDTPELAEEMRQRVEALQASENLKVIWINEMVRRDDLICLYSGARLFVCPSVYEPFGIINLEAMACETPVVASAVGGIPEVVVPGETGLLVHFEPTEGGYEPKDPAKFEHDLAEAISSLWNSPEMMRRMAEKARRRVEEHFSWPSIARQTLDFYGEVIDRAARETRATGGVHG